MLSGQFKDRQRSDKKNTRKGRKQQNKNRTLFYASAFADVRLPYSNVSV